MPKQEQSPSFLSELAQDPRIQVRRPGPPSKNGKCVVYWMQRSQRGAGNAALDTAILIANELALPVIVFLGIRAYPNANLRHYHFMAQAFPEIQEQLEERGIRFVLRVPPENSLEGFLEEVDAAFLVGDENHCREPERWRQDLAKRLTIPYWTVDADVVVPSALFQRRFYLLHHFRPKLYAELPKYLKGEQNPAALRQWKSKLAGHPVTADVTKSLSKLDRSVVPVDTFQGGPHAAQRRLKEFIEIGLKDYPTRRNHPERDGTSRLSPYLHFGNIGPSTILLAVDDALRKGTVSQEARDAYVDELVGWRELAVNFVKLDPHYDSWECAEPWAQKTLTQHIQDNREHLYNFADLEKGRTHDDLWNAAQIQMVKDGWMHNYMRMYWAKKLLEWTPNPAVAFDYAVVLNDKYELDGRDPNGYAGIAWAIAGKHDRPWFERPIFGTVRYMSRASTGKKFDSARYIQAIQGSEPTLW